MKRSIKYLSGATLVGVIAIMLTHVSPNAFASVALPTPTPTPAAISAAQTPNAINTLKTKGALEADRRISALAGAKSRVGDSTLLSMTDRTVMESKIQSEIEKLEVFKTELAGTAGLPEVQVKIDGLIKSYAGYGIVLPQAHLTASLDRLTQSGNSLGASLDLIDTAITQLESNGADIAAVRVASYDARVKLGESVARYDKLTPTIVGLAASDYAAAHAQLTATYTTLSEVRTQQGEIRTGLDDIIKSLEKLESTKSN